VYIIELDDGSYYVGHTNDLQRRLLGHRGKVACAYTKKHAFKKMHWHEEFKTRIEAAAREIKGWRREKKARLFAGSSLP
jgi:tRNA/rRNA methyltransferase